MFTRRPLVEVSSRDRAEIPVMLMTICVLIDYPEIGPSLVYMFHPCMIDSNISPSSRQVQSILAAYRAIQVVGSSMSPSRPLSGRCSYGLADNVDIVQTWRFVSRLQSFVKGTAPTADRVPVPLASRKGCSSCSSDKRARGKLRSNASQAEYEERVWYIYTKRQDSFVP
ncbi:hypothetical protein CY34DRAFT_324241 [Suillus luteus UH-Slu-Lm8-n1]|uniref:Uncharacterized protein n=1 Tax=Suillus luteus UH-Slu-Lm8-n1 TaxID=930992 RepID=A0A0C9ZPM4_9AGAM|nr:hypothetical protein CY34DRAFT_324241 [Suillus luteus UH-Slu-Lm8-n1]